MEKSALSQDLAFLTAQIKSSKDFSSHIANIKKNKSPLGLLSPLALKQFAESITFNESGITGYRYDVLEQELTLSQAYRVLALFGEQHNIAHLGKARIDTELDAKIRMDANEQNMLKCAGGDLSGYKCASRATCTRSSGSICKASC